MGRRTRNILALGVAAIEIAASLVEFSASAQWTIEESDRVSGDRAAIIIASLVSDDGMLALEYTCFYRAPTLNGGAELGLETIELYALKPNQECCDDFASGSIRYGFDQQPTARRRWNVGGAWMAPHTRDSVTQLLNGMRKYNYLTVRVEKTADGLMWPFDAAEMNAEKRPLTSRFNLAGTTAMLNEISCPTVGR